MNSIAITAKQAEIIKTITSRANGVLYSEFAEALGISNNGACYRISTMVSAGELWVCGDGRSTRKRAFSSLEAMRAWQESQPPTFSQIVRELLEIKQPITAAEFGKAVGMEPKRASGYLWPLAKRGEIVGAQCGHMWFWYLTADAAEKGKVRAEAEAKRLLIARNADLVAVNAKRRRVIPVGGIPAGVVLADAGKTFREREAQITGETKVTIAEPPRYHYRWQAVPSSNSSIFDGWPRYGAG